MGGPTGLMKCHHSSLWTDFRTHVLRSFNLLDVPPPAIPTILLSFRRRTDRKKVGRVFQDEKVVPSFCACLQVENQSHSPSLLHMLSSC